MRLKRVSSFGNDMAPILKKIRNTPHKNCNFSAFTKAKLIQIAVVQLYLMYLIFQNINNLIQPNLLNIKPEKLYFLHDI